MKKSLKLILVIAIIACLLLPLLSACNKSEDGASGTDKLVIYNWEDYIDSSLLDEFTELYKATTGRSLDITYTTYDTNETMMTKVLKGDANVDLICPSDYAIEKLLLADCLLSQKDVYAELQNDGTLDDIDFEFSGMSSLNANWGNIDAEVMDVISDTFSEVKSKDGKPYTDFMTPYMWGTLGILYNVNVVSEEELEEYGWGVLWNVQQNEDLENKILMKDSVRDTYAASVLYMKEYDLLPDGYQNYSIGDLINCTDDAMLKASEKVLTEQRDHISGYEVDFGKDDMLNEIVYADFAWSGDALWAVEESYDEDTDEYLLGYYVPEIGSNIWYDGWCIPKSVNNKLAAMMFIEFMCQPTSAISNSMEIGYTCAVAKDKLMADEDVLAILEENEYDTDEYFEDEGRYPEINESLGVMRDFGTRGEALVGMWQRAKSGNGVSPALWWCLLGIVGAVGLAIAIYFIVQALRYRPRVIKSAEPKEKE
ncbi:MAG: extracellular solute-binding protein [Clostridia bacterium]|nr:extracellular solute-binding protein [Clostridia bacterium]